MAYYISFIIDNYWSDNSSAGAVQRKMSVLHTEQENDFDTLVANTSIIDKIVATKNMMKNC